MNGDKNNASGAKPAAAEAMNDLRLGAARKRLPKAAGRKTLSRVCAEIVANFLARRKWACFALTGEQRTFQVFCLSESIWSSTTCCTPWVKLVFNA